MALYDDQIITNQWVDLISTLSLDTTTTDYLVQNKSGNTLLILVNSTPDDDDLDGHALKAFDYCILTRGTDSFYVRINANDNIKGLISIEDANVLRNSNTFPEDVFTAGGLENVRRLAVDSQQTSFEQNWQFKYFDRLDDIAYGNQIVYKAINTNPLNLFWRSLSLYTGGREYLVYPDSDNISFTGTLEDSGYLSPINANLNSHLTAHPTSGLTIQRAVGTDIFSFVDTDNPDDPIDGMLTMTAGNVTQGSSDLSVEGDKLGYSAGTVWLVMNHIGSNTDTKGQFKLKWEELFETLY